MPTFRVWIKKSIPGPAGPIEIGLGGTHEVDCSPSQVASERLALFHSYRDELDRLLEAERLGTLEMLSVGSRRSGPTRPSAAEARPEPRSEVRPPPRSEPTESVRAATEPVRAATEPVRAATEPAPESSYVSAERSRAFLAELQDRLHRKVRTASPAKDGLPTGQEPPPAGAELPLQPTLDLSTSEPPPDLAALLMREELA